MKRKIICISSISLIVVILVLIYVPRSSAVKNYTDKEIFIDSFSCGYLDAFEKVKHSTMIIETEEQLAYSESYYYLKPPTFDTQNNHITRNHIGASFQEMMLKYPFTEYAYVLKYDEVSSSGYYLHTDRLIIEEDCIYFNWDDESYFPEPMQEVNCVMGGFFHMAAIPRQYLEGYDFSNVIYPDPNDLYQDRDYEVYELYDLADEQLYQVYRNQNYLIRNKAEHDSFLSIAEDIPLTDRRMLDFPVGFDDVTLLVTFFTRDESNIYCQPDPIIIDGNNIIMDYKLVRKGKPKEAETTTCMLFAFIPKRFLTEDSYIGWVTPKYIKSTKEGIAY